MNILLMAVYNVLNGALSFNGIPVPVYDEKKREGQSANLYVVFGDQTEEDDIQPSDAFASTTTLEIIIWQKTTYEVSKTGISDVAGQILELLIPSPYGNDGLPAQNLFQILNVRRISSRTINYSLSDSQTIIGRIITIQAHIIQQFP